MLAFYGDIGSYCDSMEYDAQRCKDACGSAAGADLSCSDNSDCGASEYCGTAVTDSNGVVTTELSCTGKDYLIIQQKLLIH